MHYVLTLIATAAGCAEPRTQERIAGGLDAAGMVVDLASIEVRAEACAGLAATASALRGAADGVRDRQLPQVRLDLSRCGPLRAPVLACEVSAWVPASLAWLGGLGAAAVAAAEAPGQSHVVPAVEVPPCP